MSRCSLYLFGSPHLEVDGRPVNTDRRKALALLAYLAVTRQPHTRETLAALLWPDYEPGKAFAYLRRTLWELNQLLGEGVVLAERESVELDPQARCGWMWRNSGAVSQKPGRPRPSGNRFCFAPWSYIRPTSCRTFV